MNKSVEKFKPLMDTRVKLTTGFSILFFSFVIAYNMFVLSNAAILHNWQIISSVVVAILFFILFVLAYGYAPVRYDLHAKLVYIRRIFGDVKIPYKDIKSVQPVTDDDFRNMIRILGVAGMFGYFGTFKSEKLGEFKLYTRSKRSLLKLEMHKGHPVIIANEPGFEEALKQRLRAKIR